MDGFEVGEVHLVAGPARQALERDEVGQGADQRGRAVDAPFFSPRRNLFESEGWALLCEGVEQAVLASVGASITSTSFVARTTPYRIMAIPPITTYLISARLRSARMRPKPLDATARSSREMKSRSAQLESLVEKLLWIAATVEDEPVPPPRFVHGPRVSS